MKNIGLIGCGNIAETYFRAQEYFNNINFVACADINLDAAKKTAEQYNIIPLSVDEILTDKNIDIILNLLFHKPIMKYLKGLLSLINMFIVKNQ